MIEATRVTVTTDPTPIASYSNDRSGVSMLIAIPDGGDVIDVGGSDVASGEGFEIGALLSGITLELAPGETLYGVTATGSQEVQVLANRIAD